MYYCSKNSKKKIAHTPECSYAKRMRPANTVLFQTALEAKKAGCGFCRYCSPIGAYVKKEEAEIDRFCQEAGISCRVSLRRGCLNVDTSYSRWKIVVDGRQDGIFLYHKNLKRNEVNEEDPVPGYHIQKTRKKTVLGCLEYVSEHDAYRINNPVHVKRAPEEKAHPRKGSKKYRKEERKEKKREKRRSIARVEELLDELHGGKESGN